MKPVALLLLLGGCSMANVSETPRGHPIFVLGTPICVVWCTATIGNSTQDVRGGTGGAQTLSQTENVTGGRRR